MPYRSSAEPPEISSRQRRIACLLVQGFSHKYIARLLHISIKAVEANRAKIIRVIGVRGLGAMAVLAIRWGWIEEGDLFPAPKPEAPKPPDAIPRPGGGFPILAPPEPAYPENHPAQ